MEQKTVEWNKIKYKVWAKNEWEKAKAAAKNAVNWTFEHPMEAVALVGAAAGLTNKVGKIYCTRKEVVRRKRDFYDTRTGRHVYAKRNLKPWEEELVDERFKNGESYVSIFRDMNLMK